MSTNFAVDNWLLYHRYQHPEHLVSMIRNSSWKEHCHTLLPSPPMPDDRRVLGCCPDCGERIPTAWVLVEYKKNDGTDGVWAECPECADVVAPE